MLGWLERHQVWVLVLACLLLAGGLLFRTLHKEETHDLVFHQEILQPDGTPIRVQVAGAVAAPGVYELLSGDHLGDAISAAGGAIEGANLVDLNLARRLRDEEKITVAGRSASPAAKVVAAALAPDGKLDINQASQQQLDNLPGIGEAYARRIIDSRKVDGPYKSPRDLVQRNVIPAAEYERIREMVFVTAP